MSLVLVEIDCSWSLQQLDSALLGLPPAVQERAARYLVSGARRNLIATQAVLRAVIHRLGFSEDQLTTGPNGRPLLQGERLDFNLSHSESRAVLGISREPLLKQCLGVDIEWVNRRVDRLALARRFFTPEESQLVFKDPGAREFFRIWTRKEAILKSNGVGLRVPLDSFEVLADEVPQEISGRPLLLRTEVRESEYTVSWAVPREAARLPVHWVQASEPDWLDQVENYCR